MTAGPSLSIAAVARSASAIAWSRMLVSSATRSLSDVSAMLTTPFSISAWLARTRIAVGGPKGTSAAGLIVEAFGDAVLPQIPEAIGRAILRTEAALDAAIAVSQPRSPDADDERERRS